MRLSAHTVDVSERAELEAILAARKELGPEYEPELVDSFLERVEKRLESRRSATPRRRDRQLHPAVSTPVVLGSLGLAIPLLGVAGGTAGIAGVLVVCLALVLVNAFALRR
jgi:hypothetical protein